MCIIGVVLIVGVRPEPEDKEVSRLAGPEDCEDSTQLFLLQPDALLLNAFMKQQSLLTIVHLHMTAWAGLYCSSTS